MATPLHSTRGPVMAGQGALINKSMAKATVERAAGDVGGIPAFHTETGRDATLGSASASSQRCEQLKERKTWGETERVPDPGETAVCPLPRPHSTNRRLKQLPRLFLPLLFYHLFMAFNPGQSMGMSNRNLKKVNIIRQACLTAPEQVDLTSG